MTAAGRGEMRWRDWTQALRNTPLAAAGRRETLRVLLEVAAETALVLVEAQEAGAIGIGDIYADVVFGNIPARAAAERDKGSRIQGMTATLENMIYIDGAYLPTKMTHIESGHWRISWFTPLLA